MRRVLQAVSISMLVLTVLFPSLYLFDVMGASEMKGAVLIVTIVWFLVTPLWMGRADRAAVMARKQSR